MEETTTTEPKTKPRFTSTDVCQLCNGTPIDRTSMLCKRCFSLPRNVLSQRKAIVLSYKNTRPTPKIGLGHATPDHSSYGHSELEDESTWVVDQRRLLEDVQFKKALGEAWAEDTFKKEHPTWRENQEKVFAKAFYLVGRTCKVCKEPVSKGSKVPFCDIHKRDYRRWRNMLYKRASRARSQHLVIT